MDILQFTPFLFQGATGMNSLLLKIPLLNIHYNLIIFGAIMQFRKVSPGIIFIV